MPDNEWLHRWEDRQPSSDENEEIANMAAADYRILLEEIEQR